MAFDWIKELSIAARPRRRTCAPKGYSRRCAPFIFLSFINRPWWAEFRAVARVALKDRPDLVNELGL